MKEESKWVILDLRTGRLLYGFNNKTLRFSSEEIAIEVATQLFEEIPGQFIVLSKDSIQII